MADVPRDDRLLDRERRGRDETVPHVGHVTLVGQVAVELPRLPRDHPVDRDDVLR